MKRCDWSCRVLIYRRTSGLPISSSAKSPNCCTNDLNMDRYQRVVVLDPPFTLRERMNSSTAERSVITFCFRFARVILLLPVEALRAKCIQRWILACQPLVDQHHNNRQVLARSSTMCWQRRTLPPCVQAQNVEPWLRQFGILVLMEK